MLSGAMLGLLAGACSSQQARGATAAAENQPPPAPREFRGAWIATVNNIDWPSRPGLAVARQKAELEAILDRAAALHLNALIFQVRPMCDALYPSRLEPWSEWLTGTQGKPPAPLWDPLQTAVTGAHARGLELHAWFNPFRARHGKARSAPARNHVSRILPHAVLRYGAQLWLDPGSAAAQAHSLDVILDVVRRYDVDGVHIDDYFYPYPVKGKAFPDDRSYGQYVRRGGTLSRGDWRRRNVDHFVERLYREIKKRKPWVKFGISPFGIARPGLPRGIRAGIDQYSALYADVRKWLAEGWCDYMSPQLYWPIAREHQSYPVLLRWWVGQNVKQRHLWPGNYTSKVGTSSDWPILEILDQIAITRRSSGASGNLHFSMRSLMPGSRGAGAALRAGPYRRPALIPAMPWLDREPPRAPRLERPKPDVLRWSGASDVALWAIYRRRGGKWSLAKTLPGTTHGLHLPSPAGAAKKITAVAVSAVDRCGNESTRSVLALR